MARSRRSDDAAPPARPAPPCAECGAPGFLPCSRCGQPLCADHGLTRLLVTLCAACREGQPGRFRSHAERARDIVATPASAPVAPAAAPLARCAVWRAARGSATDGWGKVGTAAELTKRLIMSGPLGNADVHAELVKQLGADRAGPAKNVAWYRNWLKRAGHNPPEGADAR